jgi:hypothetical protein
MPAYLIPAGGDDDAILANTKDVVVRAGLDKATHDKLLRYARLERKNSWGPATCWHSPIWL